MPNRKLWNKRAALGLGAALKTALGAMMSGVLPDVQCVSSCMSAYRRHLSPACRAFYGDHRKKVRRR